MDETNPILEKEILGQGVFVSRYVHSLDPKKRLTIPSEWRAQVGSPRSLYVLPDVHRRCLRVFPASGILHRLDKLRRHSIADKQARDFARELASRSDLVAWDAQGRIRIKDDLLASAGIDENVVLVGAWDSFEIWNPEHLKNLTEVQREESDSFQQAAQYVGF
jgi:MraZ protein